MPRTRKDSLPLNVKIDVETASRLDEYCRESGLTKTAAVERAINLYIDEYDADMKVLQENR